MLAHQILTGEGATPERAMIFLHGVLGRGQNWRSMARRFVRAQPHWAAVLVDLRLHGDSREMPGPHTLQAAAEDLDTVAEALELPVRGILGHSLGGKIALAWAARHTGGLEEVWLVDSPPGARPGGQSSDASLRVLDALSQLPYPFDSRRDFVAALRERGFSEGLGLWLATNLVQRDDGTYGLGLDLDGIRSLLDSYFETDLWDQVESPPGHHQLHVVAGGRSEVFSLEDRQRVAHAADHNARVHLHVLEEAGHWIHVDAPDELAEILGSRARAE